MLFILDKSHEVVGSLNSNGDLSRITTYFDDAYVQDLVTGAETFTFSTMADTDQAQYLVAGNFIAFKDNGEFKLFNIIQIEESHEEVFTKTVYCEMAGVELINEIIRPMKVLNSSLRKFLTTILEGTEWQLGKMDVSFTQIHDFNVTDYKSVYELIQEYAVGIYKAEISYRVEIENGRIIGKYIDCYAERGNADGFRFAYGSNLTSVTRTVDMSNLATALIGVGKDITFKEVDVADKPYGQDFIANEKAYEQWNINGSHIFGIHKEDTESPQELLRLTRLALAERANPQIKYEMSVELLGREVEIGDTVNVVDHEFNPPLYLTARVNQLTRSKTDPSKDEVVLANFREVSSNITDEMRNLASQLEGYVDSQFPIGGDKIQDGAVGQQQISKTYTTQVVADAVYASLLETEELVAGKADIGELNAINAIIENLQAENVTINGKLEVTDAYIEELKAENVEINGSLLAVNANIKELYTDKANVTDLNALNADIKNLKAENVTISGNLNATNATIETLRTQKADITELNALKGNITVLESEVANIDTILAGNITADNIQTGAITAGSGIIAEGAIGNAQISSIDAGKISAGTVDTSKVTIQGSNGHLRIRGNRLQVFNGTGNQAKERVSVGDVNGDGTVYGLRVRGADGTTVLLDENGVTSEGITDGSITNEKISDNADIDGAKLNINSVVTRINEDGSESIKGTKIEIDGTSLVTKLSNITTKQTEDSERITQAQTQITANENALKLKVDTQTYQKDKNDTQTTLNKHTSEISALQGEISLKVDRTGIEEIIDEVSGELIDTKIETAKSEIKATTDEITQSVSSLQQTTSKLNEDVSKHETRIANAESKITDKAIINTVSSTIDSKINNISVGGRNYIKYGKGDVKKGFFTNFSKVEDGCGEHTLTSQKTYSNVNIANGFILDARDYEVGKQVTFSYEIMYTQWDFPTGTNRTEFWIGQRYIGGTTESSEGAWKGVTQHNLPEVGKNGCELNKWYVVEKVLTIPTQAHSSIGDVASIQFYNSNADVSASVTFRIKNVKIEYGNKATDWSPSIEETETAISDTEKLLNENIDSAISDAQNSILQNVADNYASASELKSLSETVSSNMTQTSKDIEMQFTTAQNYTKEVDGKLQDFQNTVGTNIRFSADGIDLGKTNSPFTATLNNEKLAFKQDGTEVAYISNNKMHITNAEIKETLRIGTTSNGFFTWVQGTSGNLSLKWSDK